MDGLRVGGYKNAGKSADLDLSAEVQDTSGASTEAAEETAQTKQIQNTSQEIKNTSEFSQTESTEGTESTEIGQTQETEAEPAEQVSEQNSSSTEGTQASETEASQSESIESTESTDSAKVSEELLLKSLSEKLGREVVSFDDLTKSENPLENDPYLKKLVEWREQTGRPIEDWVKFQKDYSQVSDIDVAREFLQLQFPELSKEDVELELNHKYISSEDDLDNDAALKNLELKKLVSKGRKELGKLVSSLGDPSKAELSPEVKQDLEIAKNFKEYQVKVKQSNKDYNNAIIAKAKEVKSINMELTDDVSLEYKLPEGSEKSLVDMVQEAPHWKNEDGSWNHEAVVRDAAIIANFPKMLKLAYEQGKNSGTDEIIREANNSTLGNRAVSEAALPNENKGAVIESLDKYLGKTGMRIRKRK